MSDSIHEWDGAYVLGALEPAERLRYEEHLAACSTCSRSVRELAGLPGILGRLEPDEAVALRDLPDDAALHDGAHRPDRAAGIAARVRRRRRRTRLVSAVVVVAVLLVGGIGGWAILRSARPEARPVAVSRTLTSVGDSHLTADLRATSVGWGTRLEWSCDYAAGGPRPSGPYSPVSYALVVHTDTGTTTTVATWSSDGAHATGLAAATEIPTDAITSVDIRVSGSSRPLAETSF